MVVKKDRLDKLDALGLKFNGEDFIYEDINFHWTELLCMTDQEFDMAYEGAVKRKAQIDAEEKAHGFA